MCTHTKTAGWLDPPDWLRRASRYVNNNIISPTAEATRVIANNPVQFAKQLGPAALSTAGNITDTFVNTAEAGLAAGTTFASAVADRYLPKTWSKRKATDTLTGFTQGIIRHNAEYNRRAGQYQKWLAQLAGWNNTPNLANRVRIPGTNVPAGTASGLAVAAPLTLAAGWKADKLVSNAVGNLLRLPVASIVPKSWAPYIGNVAMLANMGLTGPQTVASAANTVSDHVDRRARGAADRLNDARNEARRVVSRYPALRTLFPIYNIQRSLQQTDPNTGMSYIQKAAIPAAVSLLGNPQAFSNGGIWNPDVQKLTSGLGRAARQYIPSDLLAVLRGTRITQRNQAARHLPVFFHALAGKQGYPFSVQYTKTGNPVWDAIYRLTPEERYRAYTRVAPPIATGLGMHPSVPETLKLLSNKYEQ